VAFYQYSPTTIGAKAPKFRLYRQKMIPNRIFLEETHKNIKLAMKNHKSYVLHIKTPMKINNYINCVSLAKKKKKKKKKKAKMTKKIP
jgi:hypothetical protein